LRLLIANRGVSFSFLRNKSNLPSNIIIRHKYQRGFEQLTNNLVTGKFNASGRLAVPILVIYLANRYELSYSDIILNEKLLIQTINSVLSKTL
jgi:hypothetical protein